MDDTNQYLQMFFDESTEYIQTLNERVLELEQNPNKSKEIIDSMFRAAHSLKGMAATMGFEKLTKLSHKIENLMDEIRNDKVVIESKLVDLLFGGIDYISKIVEQIKNKGREDIDISDYLLRLSDFLDSKEIKEAVDDHEQKNVKTFQLELNDDEVDKIKEDISQLDNIYKIIVTLDEKTQFKDVRGFMVLKKASELGYLVKSEPSQEMLEKEDILTNKIHLIMISKLSIQDIKQEIGEITNIIDVEIQNIKIDNSINLPNAKSDKTDNKSSKIMSTSTVRVDINKLDKLMNMVGELLINKTRLESLNINNDVFKDIIPQLDRVTMELHHIVMQIRMVPVGTMVSRFPRMVRDLSRSLGKEIDFVIKGKETELDRSIIDELSDPLVHLLRNAIDHGIELPREREKRGKEGTGTITLRAFQKGSEIIIEVEDDGAGLDVEKIKEKALEKGVISVDKLEDLEKEGVYNLIFKPGFSTTEKVSDVSGRGVGMDVVKRTIEGLDGQIFIETEQGKGSKFIISLPLTLAIAEALLVRVDSDIFAIPLSNISETLMIKPDRIKQVKGQDVILHRNKTIPLIECKKSLNLKAEYNTYKQKTEIPVVVIKTANKEMGLIVDSLLHQQEIVVKSLSDYLENVKNISGATIIGDGDVALILDVRDIA